LGGSARDPEHPDLVSDTPHVAGNWLELVLAQLVLHSGSLKHVFGNEDLVAGRQVLSSGRDVDVLAEVVEPFVEGHRQTQCGLTRSGIQGA